MTKYFDWQRVKDMDSRKKSDINMSSTFAEQRKNPKKEKVPKDFGIKQMGENVNIDWGKAILPSEISSDSAQEKARRAMEKLAAANQKADAMKDDTADRANIKEESEE